MNFLKVVHEEECFININLSNLEHVLQRNLRTGRTRECIFRAHFLIFSNMEPSWVRCMYRYTPKKTLDTSLKMAGSNIFPRKQLKKTNDQLIEFAMKLLNNMITKSTELINNNKEFGEKLSVTDSKHGKLKKMNEI